MPYSAKGQVEVPCSVNSTMTALRAWAGSTRSLTLQHATDTTVEVVTGVTGRSWGEKIRFTAKPAPHGNTIVEHGSLNLLGSAAPNQDYRTAVSGFLQAVLETMLDAFLRVEAGGASHARTGTMVGGTNTGLEVGRSVILATGPNVVYIATGETLHSYGVGDLVTIEVGGPGAMTSGGGLIGGGFGFEGAMAGMVAASLVNTLTTRTEVRTIINVATRCEDLRNYLILINSATPQDFNLEIAGLRAAIELAHSSTGSATDGAGPDVVRQLRELNDLYAAGALTDEEFAQAKTRLLA